MNRPLQLGIIPVLPLVLLACSSDSPPIQTSFSQQDSWFTEVTEDWGFPAVSNTWDGTYQVPEITAGGLAVFDADQDGDLDLWQRVPGNPHETNDEPQNYLWIQNAPGSFERRPLIQNTDGYTLSVIPQAATIGDPDGDGDFDLYAANVGKDQYFENLGNGKFLEKQSQVGLGDQGWGTGATFCDLDADGDQDLFVIRYLDYDASRVCLSDAGVPDYCGPAQFSGVADLLYENLGDGSFKEWDDPAFQETLTASTAKGLGVLCADFDGNHSMDLYVANDGEPNHLWQRSNTGGWQEHAMSLGVAVNRHGAPESSMGVAITDIEPDGQFDLFMTHLSGQNNTRYKFLGTQWQDATAETGWAAMDWPLTGFGCAFADFDRDGDMDLAVANGRVFRDPAKQFFKSAFWAAYEEPDLLLENRGNGKFVQRTPSVIESNPMLSRGMVAADLDADGDDDLIVSTHQGQLRLFRNDQERDIEGQQIRVIRDGVDDLGATVLVRGEGVVGRYVISTTTSYASVGPPLLRLFPLNGKRYDSAEVLWTHGKREKFELQSTGLSTLQSGQGEFVGESP